MLQPGQIFAGRYCIRRRIGSGAIAEVYEARHVLTEHAVALKVLRPSSPGASARNFALEARIDALVGSPHIVHVQDAGVDESTGHPYLVLELLPGKTLAQLLQEQPEGRLPATRTLELLRQVALGLDAAHAHGVVHRNLKPENLFITESSLVKIADFGLAKVLDTSGQVTQQLRGTPFYMAPEQANCAPVSAQTDIWALGLVAYRCLSGRTYWRCANRGAREQASLGEVVCEICDAERPLPSARLREDGLSLWLPEAFDDWLLRCLQLEPRRRFASAGEAVTELQRALGPLELDSPPTVALAPLRPRAAAHRAARAEESSAVASVAPATPRPTRALRKWGVLWVAAALAVVAASVFYPLRQAPVPAEQDRTQVAAQALTPAPSQAEPAVAEPAAATSAELPPVAAEVAPAAAPEQLADGQLAAGRSVQLVEARAAQLALDAPPQVTPVAPAPLADEPAARPAAKKKKRPRSRRARAAESERANGAEIERASAAQPEPAAAPVPSKGSGLARKIGLGAPPEESPRPPPTALSE